MKIQENKSKLKSNSNSCKVWEYDFGEKNLSIARATIDGLYPDKGWAVNFECDEIYYVISGEGEVVIEDEKLEIVAGDAIFINKGKKYKVKGKNLKLLVTNSPAWHAGQYRFV